MIDNSIFENRKVAFATLGCKLNFAETSTIAKALLARGIRQARATEQADLCVVNTCSVTDLADKKCRNTIRKLHRQHPGAIMIVTGCYAQLSPEQIAQIEGVDYVFSASQKLDVDAYIEALLNKRPDLQQAPVPYKDMVHFVPACSADDRTRHFLKVQDGCDYFCSYCTIPFARGRSRNGTIASLQAQAIEVAKQGGKEIVLTGVNIADFGKSTNETFLDLLKAFDEVEGIERFRIGSVEPNLLADEIIDFCASAKRIAPHFHIPLQSGSDDVLKLMRRRYDSQLFRERMQRIKQSMPHAFVGIDVIVGSRGETPEYFDACHRFLQEQDFSQLHVFSYSERANTAALQIPYVVEAKEKQRRSKILLDLSDEKLLKFYKDSLGEKRAVLWEENQKGEYMLGFTDNYIRVAKPFDKQLLGQVELVQLQRLDDVETLIYTS